jgi:hypothetical protein
VGQSNDAFMASGVIRPGLDFERDILPLLETVH